MINRSSIGVVNNSNASLSKTQTFKSSKVTATHGVYMQQDNSALLEHEQIIKRAQAAAA
jgi:hypothetical protein